jgi:multiple sugar transport system ATP-binding protein
MTLGERIVLMKEGLVQQQGDPMELYENPVNSFVAGFIGSPAMNLFEAELSAAGETAYALLWDGMRIPLDRERFTKLNSLSSGRVLFGIRPEDIEDADFCLSNDEELSFSATADVVEPMGSETMLYLTAGDRQVIAKVNPATKASFGRKLRLQMDRSKIHLFDSATGATLR